jgi:YegS/Rv2252/BmrU family lipid kinase
MTAFVVVNPKAGNGRTGRDWPTIRAGLEGIFPLMSVAVSHTRGEIASLVRQALQDGHLDIIVVGGDGTINEAVNGFFAQGSPVAPDAVLGFVATGAGDFARSCGLAPGPEAAIARLRRGHIRRIDVGRLSCLSLTGTPSMRHFINEASFGLSGRIAARLNRARFSRLFGENFAKSVQSLLSLIGWHSPRLRLIADGKQDEIAGITLVAVANGGWFGGGLNVAPGADPGDGLFDIVTLGGVPRRRALKYLAAIRERRHLSDPVVRVTRARKLTAAPTLDTGGPVLIETDGESAGLLPATFEILPSALNLRC